MRKRYIFVIIVVVLVGVLIWKLSDSYAYFDKGYTGNNIISGDKWGVNIISVGDVDTKGKAILTKEVSTIGTTLNFDVALFEVGDEVTFDFKVENTSNLPAELYSSTLSGLSNIDSEVISYSIMPLDYVVEHSETDDGSIIKKGESQSFRITVSYDENVAKENKQEYNLSLGSTIIYKQK